MKKKYGKASLAALLALALVGGTFIPSMKKLSAEESAQTSSETASSQAEEKQSENESSEKTSEMDADKLLDSSKINIAMLKGPTAMGAAHMMSEAKGEKSPYRFDLVASPQELLPHLVKGEYTMAAVPSNLAATLYNKTKGKMQVLAVNTLGVLYMVQSGEVTVKTFKDLEGKKIFASGKGATPELALQYLAEKKGVKLDVEWLNEHSECAAALQKNPGSVALLPQPFVTVASMKNKDVSVVLDINKEWEEATNQTSSLITGVLVANKEFVERNKDQVESFLDEYKKSILFAQKEKEKAAEEIAALDIVPAPVAQKALPECNLVFLRGKEMKEKLSAYLSILEKQNPAVIGGKIPADDFYYDAENGKEEKSETESVSTEEVSSESGEISTETASKAA